MRQLVILAGIVLAATPSIAQLEIIHLDVGQGDATLIVAPPDGSGNRKTVLIDAGGMPSQGGGGQIVAAALESRGISHLDFVIVTHYDSDHVGGVVEGGNHGRGFVFGPNRVPGNDTSFGGTLADFLDLDSTVFGTGDDITVGTFVDRGDTPAGTTQAYDKYKEIASEMGTRVKLDSLSAVQAFNENLGGGATLMALAGNGFVRGHVGVVDDVDTPNERSLCFLLSFGSFHYLAGGDTIGRASGNEDAEVEAAIGEFLVAEGVNVDVLHVNHHGANNASDADFLTDVDPEVAIISLGNGNSHKHPTRNALKRLAATGAEIIQTEWGTTTGKTPPEVRELQAIFQGDIVLTTDGTTYEISTSRSFQTDG